MAHLEDLKRLDPAWTPTPPATAAPRYGIRDDEMTKPCVVLVDWSEDEATVVAHPGTETLERIRDEGVDELVDDAELAKGPYDAFIAQRHGIGRKPGAVALAVVLGLCLAIGLVAFFAPADARRAPVIIATIL